MSRPPGQPAPAPSSLTSSSPRAQPVPAAQGLQKAWQSRGPLAWALWPVSMVYLALVSLRRWLYKAGVLASSHPGRPVIVVGNVIAGGAGKTPVVIDLARHLQSRGLRTGIISRGYGRRTTDCREVRGDSLAADVGDEPALIARHLAANAHAPVPIFVARQRTEAAHALLAAYPETQVIICDDGLQHLALRRDVEICIFNDQGIGNGFLLPAGPLREPWPRAVDMVLYAGHAPPRSDAPGFRLDRRLADYALRADGSRVPLQDLRGQPLHAVAAVARPGDFFAMLQAQGLALAHAEALPDHYDFDSWQRLQDKRYLLICTEKDAVKLWPRHPDALAVPLQLHIDPAFFQALDARLTA
ncbi:tetraacyldisaccharide 4'-kinase [Acidovorax sp. NPDC077693]|uniref:tetraacyldisaccharide 4'-kinase n=1 Tax=unclassified Acidovorax TaxID=2684926 RepID=UPI0037C684FD